MYTGRKETPFELGISKAEELFDLCSTSLTLQVTVKVEI